MEIWVEKCLASLKNKFKDGRRHARDFVNIHSDVNYLKKILCCDNLISDVIQNFRIVTVKNVLVFVVVAV